jgi:hypothetical protein
MVIEKQNTKTIWKKIINPLNIDFRDFNFCPAAIKNAGLLYGAQLY